MPKLWTRTIAQHHEEVRIAIFSTTAALVAERGVTGVTMSLVAEKAGIGRATLYKYFADVGAILAAWHEEHVAWHLARLAEVRDKATGAAERLEAVLAEYALIAHQRGRGHHAGGEHAHRGPSAGGAAGGHGAAHAHGPHDADLSALVHRTEHVAAVQ